MFGNKIKKRILTSLEGYIQGAEMRYEEAVTVADERYVSALNAAVDSREASIQRAEDEAVSSVIGKLH